MNFRGRLIGVNIEKDGVTLEIVEGESIEIKLYGEAVTLEAGKPVKHALQSN